MIYRFETVCLAFNLSKGGVRLYQVLYRKWRPKVFADVVGQPQVTVTLKNELMAGRIAHAYLFTGSRGTGKTTCAKILAKAVNCLHPVDGGPCGECEICHGVENGSVMDIVEIDAASNNGVDNIRSLREEANFTPAAAKYRVYIIDEVHMLSAGAFNALLKTLEEPPAHVIFILATTEVHKLPATILSRCQRFDFHRIPPEDSADRLTYVTQQEGAELDRQAALLIARLADGAMRDALSLLDQCLGRSKKITVEVVNETAGLVGREHLFELTDAIKTQDSGRALEMIDQLHNASKDMARLCEELSSHFRNLMLIKTTKDARSMIVVSDAEYENLTKQALSTPLSGILHGLDTLQSALEKMYRGGDRRIEFEMAMIRLCTPELDSSPEALIRRIEALESGVIKPAKAVPPQKPREKEPVPNAPSADLPQEPNPEQGTENNTKPASEPSTQKAVQKLQENAQRLAEWPEVLQILKNYSHVTATAFNGSTAYISGAYVLIDAPNEIAFRLLREPAQRDNMRRAIEQVTGKVYNLGPYKGRTAEKTVDPLAELAGLAESEGIPVIKK
ncbi:DNA polymerase III subunit gamma/tau [Caproiciproducens galactitolivorans]|uniref:DNA-directed DNA polymerase n=1 Tax=Caproiciproducens galactitolivorans TaxID=642589 RepID=A0ABT4BV54_9FIRM|nr:DNA polymerase III subunit gamma/tau [Caproiciproducens galactitolivorans]MCY1714767.1 DNA polymerase III subunit gamma/tau [Caproiciproducens galactitolivorans]